LNSTPGNISNDTEEANKLIVDRIIAMWGFTEAAFGGILHALKIPFTGLFIGSIAVILITLISHYSKDKFAILKATIIVLLVKGLLSPHTPVTAYFAVFLQGFIGYLIFSFVRFEAPAALLLGFISLLFSAFQKFLITTLFFGMTFWKSIDLFTDYVFSQIKIFNVHQTVSTSFVLVSLYTLVHVIAGLSAGAKAIQFPKKINSPQMQALKKQFHLADIETITMNRDGKKKVWWKKPSRIALMVFLILLLLLTYFFPLTGKSQAYDIAVMILRAIVLFAAWYLLLSAPVRIFLMKLMEKNKFKYAGEIERITGTFPVFRRVISHCWKNSADCKGIKRMRKFISDSIVLLLICDL
jgi:hypothetical protein